MFRTVYRVEHRELTEQRTHSAVIPNVLHCNSLQSALPKKLEPGISPFGRADSRWAPLNGPMRTKARCGQKKVLAVGGLEPAIDLHVRRRKFWTWVG